MLNIMCDYMMIKLVHLDIIASITNIIMSKLTGAATRAGDDLVVY